MSGLEGRVLGRYELRRLIGRGGMADVYEGYDTHFDRVVAVKVFKREDEEMLDRFVREARLMASFRNPHLVQVYDTGAEQVAGDNRYYIVMPFMQGGTLRARIRRSPLSLAEACKNLSDIASALAYIHQQGIIHRDIKSSNVLLDGGGRCYLSDFGIARSDNEATQLTMTGNILGTVEYLAPELFDEHHKANASSDLYSLGVLLFEMVTGQLPFSAENQIALITMHINRRPPAASSIARGVSPAVDRVIFKALEKKPEQRFSSAAELAAAFCRAAAAYSQASVDGASQGHMEDGLPRPASRVAPPPVLPRTPEAAKLRQASLAATTETAPFAPARAAQTPLQPLEPLRPQPPPPPPRSPAGPLPRTQRSPIPPRRARPSRTRGWIVAVLAVLTLLSVVGLCFYAVTTQKSPGSSQLGDSPPPPQGARTPSVSGSSLSSPQNTATAQARATTATLVHATASAQAQASATAGVLATATAGSPVYQDALNSANNPATQAAEWEGLAGNDSNCFFQADGYHVTEGVNFVDFHGCNEAGKAYQNATLSVSVVLKSGHSAGIFFRLSTGALNSFSGYLFEIDNLGHYKFSLLTGGIPTTLQVWSLTAALRRGYNVANTLQVVMRGATFLCYINGIYVTQITDTTYSSAGEIGFLATTTATNADVVYSNLKVYAHP